MYQAAGVWVEWPQASPRLAPTPEYVDPRTGNGSIHPRRLRGRLWRGEREIGARRETPKK